MKLPLAPSAGQSFRVLVAEDDSASAQMVLAALVKSGFEACVAPDGAQAWTMFESFDPHLVIADLKMPHLDGHSLCLQIRRESRVPLLIFSAAGDIESQVRAFKQGVDDFVLKPCAPPLLMARIAAHLRRVYRYDAIVAPPILTNGVTANGNLHFAPLSAGEAAKAVAQMPCQLPMPIIAPPLLPKGWNRCDICDYIGPRFKFEHQGKFGEREFVCPHCGNHSLTYSVG